MGTNPTCRGGGVPEGPSAMEISTCRFCGEIDVPDQVIESDRNCS